MAEKGSVSLRRVTSCCDTIRQNLTMVFIGRAMRPPDSFNSLTILENNMTVTAKLNEQVHIALRDWTKEQVAADMSRTERIDVFRSAGWASTMFISPKSAGSTATEESWTFLKNAINSGFPKAAQNLIASSAKVAGDKTVKGQPRAYWMRQANSVIGNIKTALAKREEIAAEIAAGKSGADARTRSPETMVREALETAIKRIQKAEEFKADMDTVDIITALNAIIKRIG